VSALTKTQEAALRHVAASMIGYAHNFADTRRTYEALERRGLVRLGRSETDFHGRQKSVWRITEEGRATLAGLCLQR
jgi:predicted ArsR family transcriptional regulator